jgi:hypothetical protein
VKAGRRLGGSCPYFNRSSCQTLNLIPREELIDVGGGVGSDNSNIIRHHKPSYFDFDNDIRSSGNIQSLSAHSNFYALLSSSATYS